LACFKNDVAIVAALLEAGASIQTPGLLHSAIRGTIESSKGKKGIKKTPKLAKKLSNPKKANKNSSYSEVDTMEDVHTNLFALLLSSNYCFSYVDAAGISNNYNHLNIIGNTPLMLAILENHFEVIPEILKSPSGLASINYERNGLTGNNLAHYVLTLALHILVTKSSLEQVIQAVSLLLQCGASVTSNVDGRTPLWLHCATRGSEGDVEILKSLVEAGSNVNQAVSTISNYP
jgi:ankyrin repeat protein